VDGEESALGGDEQASTGEDQEALRIAGDAVDSAITPWTRRPTVFAQVSYAAEATDFNPQQDAIEAIDPHYYPSILGSAQKSGAPARYVGVWHKDRRISSWNWDRNISEADFETKSEERKADGFELYDFDVHVDGSTPRFDAIWVKREQQRVSVATKDMTLARLQTLITDRKAAGYRPKRIEPYKVGNTTKYIGLWVKDGFSDFQWTTSRSAADLLTLHNQYETQGYSLTDISAHNTGSAVVYSGIWLKNSEVRSDAYDSNMTEEAFRTKNAEYVAKNSVLVDLNVFYNTDGGLRYAAVWHRTELRNSLESNVNLNSAATADVRTAIDSFENAALVGDTGRFGLFVQNLTSGTWLGYNMNEPFYMASTTKLLLAAKVIDHEDASWDPTTLRATDYRGEEDRGWTLADFNGGNKPLDSFLTNMLSQSDSASTDRLWGLVEAQSSGALRRYLSNNLGMQNVGEITTICELDKRIASQQDSCVFNVSCDTFEAWNRADNDSYNATAAEKSCLAKLDATPDEDEHLPYYATLANSITPVEYGRALRSLTQTQLSAAERTRFYTLTDIAGDDGYDADQGVRYDKVSTKGGSKRKAKAQVGIMWDWAGSRDDFSQVTPRYSFAVFAEKYADTSYNPEPAMREAVKHAIRLLENR
jgi:hypothetical protein